MLNKIKFGIIGCGNIGKRHAEHICNQAELVSACDNNANTLNEFSKKFPNVRLFNSVDEMLLNDKESEVISVCTPNGLHAEHTILSLRNGKNVICEKPMALTVRDCEKMIDESIKANKDLFVVKQNRYNPPVQKIKELLDKNILGRIFSAQVNCFWNRNNRYYAESDWKGSVNLDGGILFTQFSHFIDLMLWLLGDVKNVRSYSNNFNHKNIIKFEDTLISIIEMENNCLVTLNCTINSFNRNMEGSITLFGEKGTVKIGGQYLNVLEYQNIDGYTIENLGEMKKPNDYGFYQGSMSNHDKVISNVIDVLSHGAHIDVNGIDGLRTVRVIESIYKQVLAEVI